MTIYLDSIVTDQVRDNRKRVLDLLTAEFGEARPVSITRQDAGAFAGHPQAPHGSQDRQGRRVGDTVD